MEHLGGNFFGCRLGRAENIGPKIMDSNGAITKPLYFQAPFCRNAAQFPFAHRFA